MFTKLQQHHRDRALRVAHHEMAHYVIAKAMGFKTEDVSLTLIGHNGHSGSATIILTEPLRSLDDMSKYLERRVLVLYAGAIGETLSATHIPTKGVDQEQAIEIISGEMGAEQDHAKARELINLLRNLSHPGTEVEAQIQSEIDEINNRLWMRAVELVERFEDTITGLGGALVGRLEAVGETATLSADFLEGLVPVKAIPKLAP